MPTVAESLVSILKGLNVTHVFGVPGKAIIPVLLAVNDGGLEFVLARHENGAGFIAGGYALAKDTIGVVISTAGPGGTNMITAAAQAMAYGVPVLFITGHQSMVDTGKPQGQDSSVYSVDLVSLFRTVTKFSSMVERPELFQSYLSHALDEALTGNKGAVHLNLPFDVQIANIEPFTYTPPDDSWGINELQINNAIALITSSKRPVIFAGKGVKSAKAYAEVTAFAEHFNIPVITTPAGKGAFASSHPLSVGPYGIGGCSEAREYLWSGIDLMIVLGSRLSDLSIPGFEKEMYPKHVIQFDISRKFVGKSLKVPTSLVYGDMKTNLQAILELTSSTIKRDVPTFKSTSYEPPLIEGRGIYVADVVSIISKRSEIGDKLTLFADDGSHGFIAVRYFNVKEQGSFIFDDYFACMGNAIGYSIGAKIANPDMKVVCITGDGCLFMTGTEISTAVNKNLAMVFVVINNKQLDMVTKGMTRDLGRTDGTIYDVPVDAKKFAESLGAVAFSCSDTEGFEKCYLEASSCGKTAVIEVLTDRRESPPTELRKLKYT
jgi:acetolactate synthase-1/2/3 large subunit